MLNRDRKRREVLELGKKTLRLVRMQILLQVSVWHGGICRTGARQQQKGKWEF